MNGLPPVAHQVLAPAAYRPILWARCGGCCEACGQPLDQATWDAHHRKLRSAGGPDCPCNLLALHPSCHNMHRESVHDNPEESRRLGRIVSRYGEPSRVAVDLPLGARVGLSNPVTLTCGGTYT